MLRQLLPAPALSLPANKNDSRISQQVYGQVRHARSILFVDYERLVVINRVVDVSRGLITGPPPQPWPLPVQGVRRTRPEAGVLILQLSPVLGAVAVKPGAGPPASPSHRVWRCGLQSVYTPRGSGRVDAQVVLSPADYRAKLRVNLEQFLDVRRVPVASDGSLADSRRLVLVIGPSLCTFTLFCIFFCFPRTSSSRNNVPATLGNVGRRA